MHEFGGANARRDSRLDAVGAYGESGSMETNSGEIAMGWTFTVGVACLEKRDAAEGGEPCARPRLRVDARCSVVKQGVQSGEDCGRIDVVPGRHRDAVEGLEEVLKHLYDQPSRPALVVGLLESSRRRTASAMNVQTAAACAMNGGGGALTCHRPAGTSGGIYSSTAGLRGATVAHTCGEGSCRESADQSVEIVGKPRRSDANNKSFAPNATEISSYLVTRVLFRNSTKNGEDSIFDCCRF